MKSKLLKGLALLCFISLISAFLLYSGGYFDRSTQELENKAQPVTTMIEEDSIASDSTIVEFDTLNDERFSSLKSIVISPKRLVLAKKRKKITDSTVAEKNIRMMNSSKSGAIFSPVDIDSAIKQMDVQKPEKKKQQ